MNSKSSFLIKKVFSSWNCLFGFYSFTAFVIVARLFSLPPDPKYAFLFGFSIYRVLIGIPLILFGAVSLFGLFKIQRDDALLHRLDNLIASEKQVRLFLGGIFFIILFNWIVLVVLSSAPHGELLGIRSRLLPIIIWLFVVCIVSILWLLYKSSSTQLQILKNQKRFIALSCLLFVSGLVLWLIFALTGIGIEPDMFGWGRRMVPLLSWQVGFAWIISLMLVLLIYWQVFPVRVKAFLKKKLFGIPVIDLLVVLGLWVLAMTLWYVQIPGVFGYPPDSVTNPDRDSALYEVAIQSLLNGYGFLGHELVPRPLYLFGLAIIHLFSGNSYVQIVFYQTMVIAFMPGILYLLAGKMGNRIVGVVVGLFAILREFNSILSIRFGIVSNSRMIMSDVPATLAICLVTLFCVIWLMQNNRRLFWAICSGGMLACAVLIRTQIIILIPVVALVSFFVYRKKIPLKIWIRDGIGFIAAFLLVISPWIIRNKMVVGEFVMDDPVTQTSMIAQRYTEKDSVVEISLSPGESKAEYSERLSNSISSFIQSHPAKVLEFTISHFARNLMDTVLVLPYRFDIIDYHDNAVISTAFWHPYVLDLGVGGIILVCLNLLFVSIGLAFSVQKTGLAGLIPLLFNLAYNFSNAIARNSGYRFMLPVDWISYLYYGIGLVVAVKWLLLIIGFIKITPSFEKNTNNLVDQTNHSFGEKRIAAIALVIFFLIGLSLPLSEVLIPEKYPPAKKENIIDTLKTQYTREFSENELQEVSQFIQQPDTFTSEGLLILPSFLPKNTPRLGVPAINAADYSQYLFMFIQSKPIGISLQYDIDSIKFPDFSDVIIIGCKKESIIDAKVLILENTNAVYRGNDYSDLSCND